MQITELKNQQRSVPYMEMNWKRCQCFSVAKHVWNLKGAVTVLVSVGNDCTVVGLQGLQWPWKWCLKPPLNCRAFYESTASPYTCPATPALWACLASPSSLKSTIASPRSWSLGGIFLPSSSQKWEVFHCLSKTYDRADATFRNILGWMLTVGRNASNAAEVKTFRMSDIWIYIPGDRWKCLELLTETWVLKINRNYEK